MRPKHTLICYDPKNENVFFLRPKETHSNSIVLLKVLQCFVHFSLVPSCSNPLWLKKTPELNMLSHMYKFAWHKNCSEDIYL